MNKQFGLILEPGKLYVAKNFAICKNWNGVIYLEETEETVAHAFLVLEESEVESTRYASYNFYRVLLGKTLVENFYVSSVFSKRVLEVT
jgi:hypothetical protein